jgi:hypothetical protein
LAPNAALSRHVAALEKSAAERVKAAPSGGKLRRFMQFYDAAGSWSRVERIIARVEAGPAGTDTRFIVTNLEGGRAKHLYEWLYCARGEAENHGTPPHFHSSTTSGSASLTRVRSRLSVLPHQSPSSSILASIS